MSDLTPLEQLEALADPARAESMRSYHKAQRRYLGLANPQINDLIAEWREAHDLPERIALADTLWQSDIFEARVAAAKLLTQARMRPDDSDAWRLITSWTADFDSWAVADHASMAAQKRLIADPARLDEVEGWITSDLMWQRRAALVSTLPWTKQNNPKPDELAVRDRVLGWAAKMVQDQNWFIQKAIAWWLRDLSKHDAARTRAFLAEHGTSMRVSAAKEAARHLPTD